MLNLHEAEVLREERLKDALRREERLRLFREAGLIRPGWLKRVTCHLLAWVGRGLIVAGRRLERLGVPAATQIDSSENARAAVT